MFFCFDVFIIHCTLLLKCEYRSQRPVTLFGYYLFLSSNVLQECIACYQYLFFTSLFKIPTSDFFPIRLLCSKQAVFQTTPCHHSSNPHVSPNRSDELLKRLGKYLCSSVWPFTSVMAERQAGNNRGMSVSILVRPVPFDERLDFAFRRRV